MGGDTWEDLFQVKLLVHFRSFRTWMGAHSTFEDHLKGVQAFQSPYADDELDRNNKEKDSKKALKQSKSGKHKESRKHQKEKKKGKEKDKKRKSNKGRKKLDTRNSDQSSSDEDIDTQLEKGRAAVRITRDILGQNPGLKQELRQVTIPPPAGPRYFASWGAAFMGCHHLTPIKPSR